VDFSSRDGVGKHSAVANCRSGAGRARHASGVRQRRPLAPEDEARGRRIRNSLLQPDAAGALPEFIQSHMAVLAGSDFFTVEVLSW